MMRMAPIVPKIARAKFRRELAGAMIPKMAGWALSQRAAGAGILAYHEAGHALVAHYLGGHVQRVTIEPEWDEACGTKATRSRRYPR